MFYFSVTGKGDFPSTVDEAAHRLRHATSADTCDKSHGQYR